MPTSAPLFDPPVHDGYANETVRDETQPVPIVIEFDPKGIVIKGAVLQLFDYDKTMTAVGALMAPVRRRS